VALSAVSVPVASYIFIRLCYSLFPETTVAFADVIVAIGIINLLAGGICAAAQRGLRGLLAFICINEMGLILIGAGSLNQAGVVGAVFQQLVLGVALAGFGLFLGLVSERAGESFFAGEKAAFGGIAFKAPTVALVAGIVIASLLGFPGSGGFVGHSLLLIGSFSVHPVTVALAGAALLLATYYLFTMYRLVFLGRPNGDLSAFSDLTLRERAYLLPLVGALLIFGFYPKPLLDLVRPTVTTLLSTVK
jgi:NADH-quinone oxidoreductase subunit M